MDIPKIKFTTLQLEIFRLFCIKTGEKLNQRKIAKFLKVTPTAVAKALPSLEKENLIKINRSKEMNLNLIEFNRENNLAVNLKRAENLKLFYETELSDFLINNHPGCTIILFGSYAKGEDTTKSDLDLAIIGIKNKKLDLKEFEKKLEKEIRVNYYKTFKEINKNLKENLCNGIVIQGGIEL
jgi:predicted nucleotidyltransferase